jgi:hypothetical protein
MWMSVSMLVRARVYVHVCIPSVCEWVRAGPVLYKQKMKSSRYSPKMLFGVDPLMQMCIGRRGNSTMSVLPRVVILMFRIFMCSLKS